MVPVNSDRSQRLQRRGEAPCVLAPGDPPASRCARDSRPRNPPRSLPKLSSDQPLLHEQLGLDFTTARARVFRHQHTLQDRSMERFDTAGETRGHERRLQDLRGEDRPIWNRLRRGDGSEGAWLIVARSPNMAIGTKTLPYTQGTALQSFTPQVGAGLPRLATHVCINQSFDRQPNRVAVAIRKYAEARVGEGQSLVVERLLQQVERWIVPSVARLHIYIYII